MSNFILPEATNTLQESRPLYNAAILAINNCRYGASEPDAADSINGELWADSDNSIFKIKLGGGWTNLIDWLPHTHDSDYYIKSQSDAGDDAAEAAAKTYADSLIATHESAGNASHDTRYFTQTQVNSKVTILQDGIDACYTKTESDARFVQLNVGDQTIGGNITILGDFTVQGTLVNVNSTNLDITDNIITLNKGEAGAGVSLSYAGLEIDRGTADNAVLRLNDAGATPFFEADAGDGNGFKTIALLPITHDSTTQRDATGSHPATAISYDHTASGLTAIAVQAAIDELKTLVSTSGGGNVVGPANSITDRIAVFDGTTGKIIKDGGNLISDLALASHNHDTTYLGITAQAADSATLDGALPSEVDSNSTIVKRTSNGYIYANRLNTSAGANTGAATHYFFNLNDDGFIRKKTLANVKTEIVTKAAVEASLTGTITTHNHAGVYEPAFTKNTAFNKNFGTTSGTVCQGDDSRLTAATFSGFVATLSVSQAIPNDAAYHLVAWDTVTNNGLSGFDTLTGRFTAPVAGVYLLSTSLVFTWTTTGNYGKFYKNGAVSTLPAVKISYSYGTFPAMTITLAAGDIIDTRVINNDTASKNVDSNFAFFAVTYVG